ncbi:hypothetical protein BT96DRAFT_935075 [Gymnopus androsaceus JB14]|uniref:Uncharacterized protein n=1 Tax=Gymnopus androsaceus JB14 TaxID=1447944 RepID=A0A6A4I7N1_9AGAR|nr:hypothetical protein BT96DRAFT_935075 [Gymnopus androsaceus JB14]
MSSRNRTQHTLNGSLDDRDAFDRTLSRQEVMTLFQKYPFIFKARGITHSELESVADSDDISTPVRSIISGAILQYGSLATAEHQQNLVVRWSSQSIELSSGDLWRPLAALAALKLPSAKPGYSLEHSEH